MKKYITLALFLVTLSTFLGAQEYTSYTPENQYIQYEGRINFSDASKPTFAFSGISIKAKFNGTAVKVNLKGYPGVNSGTNYFNVFIDGEFVKKFALGAETVSEVCQTNLSEGIHTIEITKRTESFLGKVEFLGFDIDGDLLIPEDKPVKKIEFIGNSITCGYGNEDVSSNGFNPEFENNYLAYSAVCARELNAQYRAISYSGRGVAFNWACSEGDVVPVIYEKYFADETTGGDNQYDHTSYTPDVIVINLGTNDHSCDSLTDENFKAPYVNFIGQLKTYHPEAKILCLTGPMNSSSVFQVSVEDIVSTSGGEVNGIYFFHQTPTISAQYAGGHWHPNTLMADINGKEVAAFIQANNLFGISSVVEFSDLDLGHIFFPNPVKGGELTIDLTSIEEKDSIQINITSPKGEIVLAKNLKAGYLNKISTKNWSGLYFLTLKRGVKIYTGNVIIY